MSDLRIAWSPSSFCATGDEPLRLMESIGAEIIPNPHGRRLTAEEAVQHLQGIDGLIAGLEPLSREVLSSADRLRAIARVGIGMDNIDHDAAAELGIRVSNTPEAPAASVAELTVTAALALLRGLDPTNRAMHEGRWQKEIHPGLHGTTALLVGFGRIGRAVAHRLDAFGTEILVADPAFSPEPGLEVEEVTLEEGLERATLVSLHAGGREEILGQDELRRLRPGSIILNSARGELINEAALLDALDSGVLAGAWLDVFWEEPYQGELTKYEQVLLTPHLGTYTTSCRREMEMQATLNLLSDLDLAVPR